MPAPVSRRGLTLVELLVGLTLGLAVSGVAYRLLPANLRVARAQAQRVDLQDNLRAGALIVTNELRELGYDSVPDLAEFGTGSGASSDVLIGQVGRIRYRAMRGLGFTCLAPTADQVHVHAATWMALRQPAAGIDSVALFVEGDPSLVDDDRWVRAGVTSVSPGVCADGTPAIALATSWELPTAGAAAAARMAVGGPVRVFEIMELQYYPQEGRWWLGLRSVSRGEVIQPLIGPLADSGAGRRGLTLDYLDQNDIATGVMADVRTITVGLLGFANPASSDSFALVTQVALRNMLRP